MTDIEFNKSLRELNKAYRDLFGSIPCISDFSCTREEYSKALKQAINDKKEITEFLTKAKTTDNKEDLI